MPYDGVKAVLKTLGEDELEVARVLILKVGCVSVRMSEKPALSSRFPITEMEESKARQELETGEPPVFQEQIVESLRKSPNVFDIDILDDTDRVAWETWPVGGSFLVRGKMFALRVDLPERFQKYATHRVGRQDVLEQFHVISSGSLFVAFAAVADYPFFTYIGHEYRELLQSQIRKETQLKSPPLGPSPIHPDFYIVIRENSGQAPRGVRIYSFQDDVFIVLDGDGLSDEKMVCGLFSDTQFILESFYCLMQRNVSLLDYGVEIFNHFTDLSSFVAELSGARWWQIYKAMNLARRGKKSLSTIYTRIVEYETTLFNFKNSQKKLLGEVMGHPVLQRIHSYLFTTSDVDVSIPPIISSALDHFQKELQSFGATRAVVMASLIGGAVGALLTALLK